MNEKQVLRAITKDFNFPKSKVGRLVTPKDKATALFIHLPKLFELGGPADVAYLIEYKSHTGKRKKWLRKFSHLKKYFRFEKIFWIWKKYNFLIFPLLYLD